MTAVAIGHKQDDKDRPAVAPEQSSDFVISRRYDFDQAARVGELGSMQARAGMFLGSARGQISFMARGYGCPYPDRGRQTSTCSCRTSKQSIDFVQYFRSVLSRRRRGSGASR
jgi:hypothetical protein